MGILSIWRRRINSSRPASLGKDQPNLNSDSVPESSPSIKMNSYLQQGLSSDWFQRGAAFMRPSFTYHLSTKSKKWAKAASLITAGVGLLGMIGWLANVPLLAQGFLSHSVLIAPRAAFLFFVLGIVFFRFTQTPGSLKRRFLLLATAGFSLLLSLLNHVEFPLVDKLLEPMLLRNLNMWEYVYRDRMPPLNTYTFLLLAPAFILLTFSHHRRKLWGDLAGGLALFVLLSQGVILLGYAYGDPISIPTGYKPSSFLSAIAFLTLSTALIVVLGPSYFPLRPFSGPTVRARLLRTFLPIGMASIFIYSVLLFTVFRFLNPALSGSLSALLSTLIVGILVARSSQVVSGQIEYALRDSQHRFSILVESLKDYAIYLLDPMGHVSTWNPGAERIKGYRAEEIIGEDFSIFYTPEDKLKGLPTHVLQQARLRGIFRDEGKRVRKDGSIFWADILVTAIYDDQGHVRGFSKVVRDISDRKKAEEVLRQKNAFIQLLRNVSSAANEASTLEEAMQKCLEEICQQNQWPLGHALVVTPGTGALVSACWHLDGDERFNAFKEKTEALTFLPGVGLPGRALVARKPIWIMDVTQDPHFPRKEAARAAGLRAGCAFPILSGSNVVGVLEFFSDQTVEPTHILMDDVMVQVSTQLGRVAERQKVQAHLNASLREKEVLLKEIHHRVKNNLQIISSLLRLQSEHVTDPDALAIFKESQNRVNTMALIHEYLYQSPDMAHINFSEYIHNLVSNLTISHGIKPGMLKVVIEVDPLRLDLDIAIPCGLIITELVSNALKYAFPRPTPQNQIFIGFHEIPSKSYQLKVKDNGVGLPEDLRLDTCPSLGLRLVRAMTHQLGGRMQLQRVGGTEFNMTFTES